MIAEDLARLHAALDVLEGREAELLVWGDTEGAFTDADILSLFTHHFPDENGKILMQDLQDAAMLFSIPNTKGTQLYRTRMAESVHLFRHQRQWFRGQQLSRTRTLVADYRFIRRPRSYPERKYPAEKVLSQLSDVEWMNDIKRQALRALIGDFSIAGFQSRQLLASCEHGISIAIIRASKKQRLRSYVPAPAAVKPWRSICLH